MRHLENAKTLLIVCSYHHGNTMNVAQSMSEGLHARIITQKAIDHVVLDDYQIIGFGAGIDSGKHDEPLIDLCRALPYDKTRQVSSFQHVPYREKKRLQVTTPH